MANVNTGSCLCGGISYRVKGEMSSVTACHCTQCRKQTGNYYTASQVDEDALTINDDNQTLKWYRASPQAQRGFCGNCGSALFWKRDGSAKTSVLMGSLDTHSDLQISQHIYTADKGDYYEIEDGIPQFEENDDIR